MTTERADTAPVALEPPAQLRPKHLPLSLRSREAPAVVPARMINEVLFCERLLYLEWAQGEWADNAFTADGSAVHARVDTTKGDLPAVAEEERVDSPMQRATSVWLTSETLGITSKIDFVSELKSGEVLPIEYKRGHAPDVPEGAYLPERAQVAAQVLLLREHGYRVPAGAIYFAGSKRRVPIVVDAELENIVRGAVVRAKQLVEIGEMPPPLVADPKCGGCSLSGICLPDETRLLREHNDEVRVRRLVPARDDSLPVHVQAQGGRVGVVGDEIEIATKDEKTRARLSNTSSLSLYGNVQLSTQAARTLLEEGIPTAMFSFGGWFSGMLMGFPTKNIELRIAQHAKARDPVFCLSIARRLVACKVRNSRTLLRRNDPAASPVVLLELEQLAKKAEVCEAIESLLGLEGTAARSYFGAFTGMLKAAPDLGAKFDAEGRNRRPPRDPLNALLSFAYALLTKEFTVALTLAGLEPMLGVYHQPRFGRPALALDLMEEFRPLVADSIVISVLNNGVLDAADFVIRRDATSLAPTGRKKFLLAYERRMDQLVTHPVFDYRISYRRVLEVQARLFGRVLLGEADEYPSFRTR
jgi:CRISP-associated protein Cas1